MVSDVVRHSGILQTYLFSESAFCRAPKMEGAVVPVAQTGRPMVDEKTGLTDGKNYALTLVWERWPIYS